jgi:RNA-directed DNA polymerase
VRLSRLKKKERKEALLYSRPYLLRIDRQWMNKWTGKVQSSNYWSATTNANNTNNAWIVNMNNGNVNNDNKTNNNNYVWPVRAGEWNPGDTGKKALPHFNFKNLYASYRKCRKHKRGTINALKFEINAEENLFKMAEELLTGAYRPSRSVCFVVDRPKMREIVAADFRDRVVHHLLIERLEAIFEPVFVHDSYACRKGKGLHKAVTRAREFIRKGSSNGNKLLYFTHLDISNFFMSVDKDILFSLIGNKVKDETLLWLARIIIFHDPVANCVIKGNRELIKHLPAHKSLFHSPEGKGLPVGNLTSQFFANVYLNELDQFVKHTLKFSYYVRYCDDFLLFGESVQGLIAAKDEIAKFLSARLQLALNEKYSRVMPVRSGIDFLGYIIRPDYLLVRRRVANNMKTKLSTFEKKLVSVKNGFRHVYYLYDQLEKLRSVVASYFGHLKWANTYNLRLAIVKRYDFLMEFFAFEGGRLKPLYRFREIFPNVRSQYFYFANLFKGAAVFMQVGCFYEFYSSGSPIPEMFSLKRLRPNNRGTRYGFPVAMGDDYAKRAAEKGLTIVFVMETGKYFDRIKCRLPRMKMRAV